MKRLSIEIDDKLYINVKTFCARNGTTIKELLTEIIKEKIK